MEALRRELGELGLINATAGEKMPTHVENQSSCGPELLSHLAFDLSAAIKKIAELEARVGELNQERIHLKNAQMERYADRKFRHAFHEDVFVKLHALARNTDVYELVRDLEKYVKSREERMSTAEKEARLATEELKATRSNLNKMVEQIAGAAKFLDEKQSMCDALKRDLTELEESLAKEMKVNRALRVELEGKLIKATALNGETAADLRLAESRAHELAKQVTVFDLKLTEMQTQRDRLYETVTASLRDRDEIINQARVLKAEKEVLENKVSALELSNSKLIEEVADSTVTISQREAIIEQLIAGAKKGEAGISNI